MTAESRNKRSGLDQAIGGRIRMLRKMRSISQPELAAAIGLSFQQVQRYETGESSLSVATLSKIALALGVAPAHLLDIVLEEPADAAAITPWLQTPGAGELLEAYATLDSKGRSHVLAITRALASAGERPLRSSLD